MMKKKTPQRMSKNSENFYRRLAGFGSDRRQQSNKKLRALSDSQGFRPVKAPDLNPEVPEDAMNPEVPEDAIILLRTRMLKVL